MMAIVEAISKLGSLQLPEKQEHYEKILKLFTEKTDNAYEGLDSNHLKNLCEVILDDFKKETSELPQGVKLLQCLFQNKSFQKIFIDAEKVEVYKSILSIIDSSQHENVLVNCFSVLIQLSPPLHVDITVLNDLLLKMEDVLSKKSEAISAYFIICNYFQKFLKDYEGELSNFIPVLSKLVFLPLCHPSTKVREVAEKNLEIFPKLLLYAPDEEASAALLKLVKETYSKDLLLLFKDKQELYALKVWKHVVSALGNTLPSNLPVITPFFQVIEKGFKSPIDEVVIQSFVAWKNLINSFASSEGTLNFTLTGVINDSKKLRFILKPFKNIARSSEGILSVACDSWWYLAWSLSEHLSSRFTEVCIPLIELTVGKITNGHPEKIPKGGPLSLMKKGCYILLRFLEQPPCDAFNRISSPKKMPHIPYPALQTPVELKVITHHFKEILYAFRILIDTGGTRDDMKHYLECIMKSVLYIVSSLIEDANKESVEAITTYLNFLTDIIDSKAYPALLCLKCIESLSKLSRKVLVSHHFNCGSRTSQDILCISLLKLLLNPHIFPSESPKRFSATYNRLVQAGVQESFYPLQTTEKFMHAIRTAIGTKSVDVDALIDVWSGVATPILEIIEKTQEVNQGDKQEHDFSSMYDVLIFPFEYIFPVYIHQFRTRPSFKLWTTLYKAFIRSAALVLTTATNEACENFCLKLKACLKEDIIKKPHFFETVCLFLQVVIESIDFAGGGTSGAQSIADVALMVKRKKPLGNLTSFVDILSLLLKTYHTHFIEEEDSTQTSAPAIQRKLHIVKNAAPIDLVKSFFGSIKSGGIIPFCLEQLADPLSKLFLKSSQKRNLVNHVDAKLEMMWNVVTSTIERYYLGPYDSEFLAILSPLLETTFSYPKRHLKEKSRRFWFATFGPNASSLKFPESLKNILKKMKLPLLPDTLISPTEFSISPLTDSVPEDSIDVSPPALLHSALVKALPVKSTPVPNGDVTKVVTKENKPASKISIDDLPSEEFVRIVSPVVVPSVSKRRSIRKRKSFVPSLYNDLSQSQDLSNMESFDSQDTTSSAPLEEPDFKEPLVENKEVSEKDPSCATVNNRDVSGAFKALLKSPIVAKFEESLDKSLQNEQNVDTCIEVVIESSGSGSEDDDNRRAKKPKLESKQSEVKSSKTELVDETISASSMCVEKKATVARSTRRSTKLSQSFSAVCDKKNSQNKLEFQKLNKSCIELINLTDSEEIIPSSQGSSENEASVKFSSNGNETHEVLQLSTDVCVNEPTDQLSLNCALPSKDNVKISFDVLMDENVEVKRRLTSTPLKTKPATVLDDNIDTNKEFVQSESNKGSLNHETELVVISEESNDKPPESSENKEASNNLENICEEVDKDSPMEIEGGGENVEEMNDMPDAMDDDDVVLPSPNDDDSKDNEIPQSEVQMKDVAMANAENTASVSSNVENEKNCGKEIFVKISRLSLRKPGSSSLEDQSYSQKLRKKSNDIGTKQRVKIRRRRSMKEITKDSNKETADILESDVVLPENPQNVAPFSKDGLGKDSNKEAEDSSGGDISIVVVSEKSQSVAPCSKDGLDRESKEDAEDTPGGDKSGVDLLEESLSVAPSSKDEHHIDKRETCNEKTRRKSETRKKLIFGKSKKKSLQVNLKEKNLQIAEISNEESNSCAEICSVTSEKEAIINDKEKIELELDEIKRSNDKTKEHLSDSKCDDTLAPKENIVKDSEAVNKNDTLSSSKKETRRKSLRQSILRSDRSKKESPEGKSSQNLEMVDTLSDCKAVVSESQMKDVVKDIADEVAMIHELSNKETIKVSDALSFENVESCEIFDTCSENTCGELHDDKNLVANDGTLQEPIALADSVPEMKEIQHSLCSAETVPDNSPVPEKSNDADESNAKEEMDEIKMVMMIPSSLENDDSLRTCPKFTTSNTVSSDPSNSASLADMKDNIAEKDVKDAFCVQFSDTEDDPDHEIHDIVKSIVDASSSESNDNCDLEKDKAALRLQFTITSSAGTGNCLTVNMDEMSQSADIEKDEMSQSADIEGHESPLKDSVEKVLIQPSQNDTLLQDSCSLVLSSSDSSVSCNSNNPGEFISENSEEMDIDYVNYEKESVNNTCENKLNPESNLNVFVGEPVINGDNLIPHIEHSYSIKKQSKSESIENDNSSQLLCKDENFGDETKFTEEICQVDMEEVSESPQDKLDTCGQNVSADIEFSEMPKNVCNPNDAMCEAQVPSKETVFIASNNAIKCVLKDLIVCVEKLHDNYNEDGLPDERDDLDNVFFTNQNQDLASSKIDSDHAADKENQALSLSEAEKLAKGSKKRKNKAPIRTPSNFKQPSKTEGPKQPLTKVVKTVNLPPNQLVPHFKDVIIKNEFSKSDNSDQGNTENSMTKIISSIVDSVTENEMVVDSEMISGIPSSSQAAKSQNIELSNDELTDLNTRLNASIAPQTRRSKLIAATQIKCPCGNENANETSLNPDIVIVCEEDSSKKLSSILKKRKASLPLHPAKMRKVTFASPLIQELVFETFTETNQVESVNMCSLQTMAKKRKKILQEKNKPEKAAPVQIPPPSESEDVPSSSEYQDSDVLDFCDLPVSPALINCQDSISSILKDLTSPSWVRGLESLLLSKNIKTIGDVCKLNIHQLKALPIKSPRVLTLHKSLMAHLSQTQESVLEKFKIIDDGSIETETLATSSKSSEVSKTEGTENIATTDESKLLEETVKDLLKNDKLKELPFSLVGKLIEACGKIVVERSTHS